jgi:hypothetical protein
MITPNADLGKSLQSRMSTSRDRTAALQGEIWFGRRSPRIGAGKIACCSRWTCVGATGLSGSIGITGWRKKRQTALKYLHIGTSALMITETLTDS